MPCDGGDIKAITLTREHKAIYAQERTRIEKSGGFVSKDGRLGGRIEVSRSFGDPLYKDAGMSALPDMKVGPDVTVRLSPVTCYALLDIHGKACTL